MNLLEIHNINSGYGNKHVLFDVSLNVEKGSVVLLVGSNGSGKSTLLKTICGITSRWSGSIEYDGKGLQSKTTETQTHVMISRGIQYVPQKSELFEDATVMDNLQYALLHLNNKKEATRRIEEVLESIPSLKPLIKHRASKLSGGERKKLGLAMVMANRPKLLLYDEPLAGLSEDNIPTILDLLGTMRSNGTTMLIVEHHVAEMMQFADISYGMRLGYLSNDPLNSLDNIKDFMI